MHSHNPKAVCNAILQAAVPSAEPLQDIRWSGSGTGEQAVHAQAGGSVTDVAMSIWKRATSRLFDLESRIVMQVHMLY